MGTTWDKLGTNLGPTCDQLMINLGPTWNHLGNKQEPTSKEQRRSGYKTLYCLFIHCQIATILEPTVLMFSLAKNPTSCVQILLAHCHSIKCVQILLGKYKIAKMRLKVNSFYNKHKNF